VPVSRFEGRALVAVFAHPDDESLASGGLLARCASLGVRTSLVCVTSGEARPSAAGENPGTNVRERELQDAARTLGIAEVVLLRHEDGMLPWIDAARLEGDIAATVGALRPDVVVTFGEDGLYWHPDHIAVHERTTAAIAAQGTDRPALYYVTMPPGAMARVLARATDRARAAGTPAPTQLLGIADPDAFGAAAAVPTLVVDVSEVAARKLAAIRSHRSQLVDDAFTLLTDADARELLAVEHYRRAGESRETFLELLSAVRI
jgi:LmbE family N-acetylglucosaminyl deacetylase